MSRRGTNLVGVEALGADGDVVLDGAIEQQRLLGTSNGCVGHENQSRRDYGGLTRPEWQRVGEVLPGPCTRRSWKRTPWCGRTRRKR
jgi:hypothetical protein